MAEIRQKITKCVSKNSNYDQGKLEDILSAIISKTSASGTVFSRIEVEYSTESPIKATRIKIRVKEDVANFRLVMKIQLIGHTEIWIVNVYVNRLSPKHISALCKEAREASKSVCKEEDSKHQSPDERQGKPASPPVPSPNGSGAASSDGAGTSPLKKKRRMRNRASSVITEKVVLEILEKWIKIYAGAKIIDQTEFWEIISLLGIIINRLSVLNFLGKRGFVKVIPIRQKPQVEITQLGLDLLDRHHQQLEVEKSEAEEKERLKKALAFPGEFLSFLKEFQELQSAYAELERLKADEKEIPRQIVTLQEKLANIEPAKQKCLEGIEALVLRVNQEKIIELIEKAEKSAQAN